MTIDEKKEDLITVLIPCRNEEENIKATIKGIQDEFDAGAINLEVLVVDDGSNDNTEHVVQQLHEIDKRIKLVKNEPPYGLGNAIKEGLEHYKGDYVIIAMADASDNPKDMVKYVKEVRTGYDCCFGTRWGKGTHVEGYPKVKLLLNRFANFIIQILFQIKYNDVTNAFKCYSRATIEGVRPILSHHFNITVELPLKAMVRGYSWNTIPTNWKGRKIGESSLKIKEMGSRYLFIIMCVWLEKMLSKEDYRRK